MSIEPASPSKTYNQLLRLVQTMLSGAAGIHGGNPEVYAEQLFIAAYRKEFHGILSRMELYIRGAEAAPGTLERELLRMAGLCAAGEPLQYVTGVQSFLDHEYLVSREVLIPRPETEVLVSTAIEILSKTREPLLGFELGLGSGVISIELLARFSKLKMVASELSGGAAQLARENAERILGAEASKSRLVIHPVQDPKSVWEPAEPEAADFFISNPPYLAGVNEADFQVTQTEPHQALFAPVADPGYFYRKLAEILPSLVRQGGYGFFEIPHERSHEIQKMFASISEQVVMKTDLSGRDRVLCVKIPGQ